MCWDHQAILKNTHDSDSFATVWLAGNANTKVLKSRFDINSICISSTCNRLLALAVIACQDEENALVYATDTPPPLQFRHLSKLYMGTLRIYQQQVDCLLELSHHLVQSSNAYLPPLAKLRGKRKLAKNLKSIRVLKKRRKNHSGFISSYDELYHEVEALQNWSKSQSGHINELMKVPSSNRHTLTLVQVREITVQEFSVNDDEGFGNATADEMEEFRNFNIDLRNVVKTGKKRKISTDNSDIDCTVIKRTCPDQAYHSMDLDDMIEIEIEEPRDSQTQNLIAAEEPIVLPMPVNRNGSESPCFSASASFVSKSNQATTTIQSKACSTPVCNKRSKKSNKRRRLIIDKRKELSFNAIESNFYNYSNLQCRNRNLEILPQREHPTVTELLSRSCRNVKQLMPYKCSQKLSPAKASEEYMNIITAIFDDVNMELAYTIYPKYQQQQQQRQQMAVRNKRISLRVPENLEECADELNHNIDMVIPADVIKSDQIQDDENIKTYGVMVELLDIWRGSNKNEVDANTFCQCAKSRFQSAAKFYSLLVLAATEFIVLKHKKDSIEIDVIQSGPGAFETLLHKRHIKDPK